MRKDIFIIIIASFCIPFLFGCSDAGTQIRDLQRKYEQVKAANEALEKANHYLTEANKNAHEQIREMEELMIRVREDIEKERLAWQRLYTE